MGTAIQNRPKCSPGSGSNAAKAFAGSVDPARAAAAAYKGTIQEKLDRGLTAQRIWQSLVEEYGYFDSNIVAGLASALSPNTRDSFAITDELCGYREEEAEESAFAVVLTRPCSSRKICGCPCLRRC
jgi:hypothetical protein